MNQSGPARHRDPGRPTPTPRPGTRPVLQTQPPSGAIQPVDYRAFISVPKRPWFGCFGRVSRERRQTSRSGPRAGPHDSDNLPRMAAVCGFPTADRERKKNVPKGRLGGGRGTVVQPSPPRFQRLMNHTNCGGCCLENPGPVAAVSTGARSGAGAVPAKRPSIRTSSKAVFQHRGASRP